MASWPTVHPLLVLCALATACVGGDPSSPTPRPKSAVPSAAAPAAEKYSRILQRFVPLNPAKLEQASELVELGRALYYDPRLSRTGEVSCNSCHPLDQYGATATRFSSGIGGQLGARNAPSTYHAAGHFAQFWDGRESTIEEQAKGPLQNPSEMGMTPERAVAVLRSIKGYRTLFKRAFPSEAEPVTFDNVAAALGAFERGLITPAPWDEFLRGKYSALSLDEMEGAKLFSSLGCIVCHTGPYVGGSMFEKVGARIPWPASADSGRRRVTGSSLDEGVFKVPSLRNVAKTAPYFHDGSAPALDDAIRTMGRHQLGVELDPNEVRLLAAWLSALTGELPHSYIARPTLPGES